MHAAYTWAIADALDCAGVEVPYPQLDVRLRSLFGHEGDTALGALRLDVPRPAHPSPTASPVSTNDAADDVSRPLPNEDAPG